MRAATVWRARDGSIPARLALRARVAETAWEAARGLLGRRAPALDEGLWLPKCGAIHMMFMGYAIDAVFMDAEGRILRVAAGLRPWRLARARGARATLETAAGSAARLDLRVGDRLRLDAEG